MLRPQNGTMRFDPGAFPDAVAGILLKYASHPLPLTRSDDCDRESARVLQNASLESLFPAARNANAALSGLLLLLGCWDESHRVSQDIPSAEGSYWHAIAHRIEPDSSNSGYWFRRVGEHPIFRELHREASTILERVPEGHWRLGPSWDPFLFNKWCDEARAQRGEKERVATEIQQIEWQLLFEWCAARGQ